MKKTTSKSSRYAASETLCRLQRTQYPVKPLLESVSSECNLSTADRGFAMNIVYGVLRHRQYLDSLIEKLSRFPITKMDTFIHSALLTGLYQLFYMDRVPESAAVNEAVNAVRAAQLPKRLQGFVNGILREAIRKKSVLPPLDIHNGKPVLNHPQWMTDRWQQQFGQAEMKRICDINNREPQLILRTNSARATKDELLELFRSNNIDAQYGNYAPDALVLSDYQGPVNKLPGYQQGLFQPQDEAAQLATLLLEPIQPGGVYLDGCAGLGGKTSHLLQLTRQHNARVAAIEPEPRRQRLFDENMSRLSADNLPTLYKTTLQDFCRTSRLLYTGVFIDAPCSGTGVTGRHPDIRWNRTPEDILNYRSRQLDILTHSAQLVTPGGILVYATCSLEQEENGDVVEMFLRNNSEFKLTDCRDYLPASAQKFVTNYFFAPHPETTIDGFFAARLERIK